MRQKRDHHEQQRLRLRRLRNVSECWNPSDARVTNAVASVGFDWTAPTSLARPVSVRID